MDGEADLVKGIVFPLGLETPDEIDNLLTELREIGLISFYFSKGKDNEKRRYLHVNKWESHQTLRTDRMDYRYPTYGKPKVNRTATAGMLKIREEKIREEKGARQPKVAAAPSLSSEKKEGKEDWWDEYKHTGKVPDPISIKSKK